MHLPFFEGLHMNQKGRTHSILTTDLMTDDARLHLPSEAILVEWRNTPNTSRAPLDHRFSHSLQANAVTVITAALVASIHISKAI